MTVDDVLNEVVRCGGDANAIYVGKGNPEDRYAILQDARIWKVYYSEKGQQLELQQFGTEKEACEYLLSLLKQDQTLWGNTSR